MARLALSRRSPHLPMTPQRWRLLPGEVCAPPRDRATQEYLLLDLGCDPLGGVATRVLDLPGLARFDQHKGISRTC